MNENNKLKLVCGSLVRVVDLQEGITVAIPTRRGVANAKVLDVNEDGGIAVHWIDNWNMSGDFSTELMRFDSNLVLDTGDLQNRNAVRNAIGIMPVKK